MRERHRERERVFHYYYIFLRERDLIVGFFLGRLLLEGAAHVLLGLGRVCDAVPDVVRHAVSESASVSCQGHAEDM